MLKPVFAAAFLLVASAGAAHADYGDMRLYQLATMEGSPTLRVTEIDSVTMIVQQCDTNGIGCGTARDFKRPNSKAKVWSWKYPGGTIKPETLTFTKLGNIIFSTSPMLLLLDDDEAKDASLLRAIYRPR
ncbi:hypothetical protein NLN96_18955 [Citrobacter portucalensis]|uniref:hypothetical protein n=1 Tax=Citrobacter portucalensis TaxID=1639133 RepID=UPI00226B78A9|nr:hypothetical protein [Citrobacter portucalensis]MCX9019077.1 hypothetical protein [Citrobacter portucalensis]